MPTNDEKSKELPVRLRLARYLENQGKRKTPERFAILEKIYSSSTHVDVGTLYTSMLADGFRVSRSTVYNTLGLLIEAGLIRSVALGDGITRYERITTVNNHHHLVCTHCGKVKEVKATELVGDMLVKKPRSFEPSYYSLYIYGLCSRCSRKEHNSKKKTKKINIHK